MKSCGLELLQSLRQTRSFLDKQKKLGRGAGDQQIKHHDVNSFLLRGWKAAYRFSSDRSDDFHFDIGCSSARRQSIP
jgi:hypothetical protein